jgi:gamma-glutamylcyclotransferase (GGCT)/AIG2-like uncharacterized protein YtfP
MSAYLFTYGTLRPGYAPEEIASAVAALRPVGEGFARGVLYDLGEYPGAVLDPTSDQRVFGTVFRLPEERDVLRRMDEYEGFDPEAPEESLFVRGLHEVELESGSTLRCWVYGYNGETGSAPAVDGGRYRMTAPATEARTDLPD